MHATPPGIMLAVQATEDQIPPGTAIAAINTPGTVVLSGQDLPGFTGTPLRVQRAFHSSLMDGILEEFRAAAAELTYREPHTPVISNLTGQPATTSQLTSPDYWTTLIRATVRYHDGVQYLNGQHIATYLELGPDTTLTSLTATTARLIPAQRRDRPQTPALLTALAQAHVHGHTATWTTLLPPATRHTPLPTYPFQHQRYWIAASEPRVMTAAMDVGADEHPLLGGRLDLAGTDDGTRYVQTLSAVSLAWIADYRILGTPVLPPAAMLEWAVAAVGQDADGWELTGAAFGSVLALDEPAQTQTAVEGDRVRCYSRPADRRSGWSEHLSVHAAAPSSPPPPCRDLAALRETLDEQPADTLYKRLWRIGVDHGPAPHCLRRLWHGDREALGWIELADTDAADASYRLHPLVLDACWQVIEAFADDAEIRVPAAVERITIHGRLPARAWCHLRRRADDRSFDMDVLAESGEVVLMMEGLRPRPLNRAERSALADSRLHCYDIEWLPLAGPPPQLPATAMGGTCLLVGEDAANCRHWQRQLDGLDAPAIAIVTGAGDGMPGVLTVDPDSDADVRRLFAELRAAGTQVGSIVLHSGTTVPDDDVPGAALRVAGRAFRILTHFLDAYNEDRPTVVLCSSGAAVVSSQDAPPQPSQAVLTGLARAVIADYPDLRCVHVDVDPADVPSVRRVLDQVADGVGATHLAQRGEQWFEARLREVGLPDPTAGRPSIQADATYQVIGPADCRRLAVAGWLVDRGARCLVIDDDDSDSGIAALRARGVRVELSESTVEDLPPLRGVLALDPSTPDGPPLAELDWDTCAPAVAARLDAGWSTAHAKLDFLVFFSSMSSLVASGGRVGALIGDAFTESVGIRRQLRGLRTLCVHWGPWEGADRVPHGMDPIDPGEAMQALEDLLASDRTSVGVARMDWHRLLSVDPRRHPYGPIAGMLPDPLADLTLEHAEKLAAMVLENPEEARDRLHSELLTVVTLLLGMTAAEREELRPTFAHTRLNQLGVDSLTTMQLRDRLRTTFAVEMPTDVLFGGTAHDVVEQICVQLTLRAVMAAGPEAEPTDEDTEVFAL